MARSIAPLLLHIYSSFSIGGAQVRFAAIANRYPGRWRHAIVAMDGDLSCRERFASDVQVEYPEIPMLKGDTIGNIRGFRRVLRALRPHALVTSNWGSIEWAMANAAGLRPLVRHVHTEDGFGPDERSAQLPRRVWTRRIVLRRSLVVVPSHVLLGIAKGSWRLPRVRYIANGIDLARFDAPDAPVARAEPVIGTVAGLRGEKNVARLVRAWRLPDHAPVVMLPARLSRWKGQAVLIKAMAAIRERDAICVLLGEGRPGYAKELTSLAHHLGIADRLRLVGHCEDIPAALMLATVAVSASTAPEGFGRAVIEAQAMGCAVVATNHGGAAETVEDLVTGWHMPPSDPAALAAILDHALSMGAQDRQALGERARASVLQHYTVAAMQDATLAVYAELL